MGKARFGLFLAILAVAALAMRAPRGSANDHGTDAADEPHAGAADVKAPIAELMHCPLAFAGVHVRKDKPSDARVAYHFCKPVTADLNQCVLYDGTGPDARLIGVEYIVSDAVYQSMDAEEKAYWHPHAPEVDLGLLKSLTQTGDDEKKTLQVVRGTWGKVFHTWADGDKYPRGPARLFWSVTGEAPFVLPKDFKAPPELKREGAK